MLEIFRKVARMSAPGGDGIADGWTPRDLAGVAGFGLAFFAVHHLALMGPRAEGVVAAIGPAGGLGLAGLLLSRRRLWPAILAVLFVAGTSLSLLMGRSIGSSAGFMAANVMESAACAWLITRVCGERVRFSRVREIVALGIAATLVNAVTATVGAGAGALTSNSDFGALWQAW